MVKSVILSKTLFLYRKKEKEYMEVIFHIPSGLQG